MERKPTEANVNSIDALRPKLGSIFEAHPRRRACRIGLSDDWLIELSSRTLAI